MDEGRHRRTAMRLGAAGFLAPDLEAAELLADRPAEAVLRDRLRRREHGEPLAWITGRATFAGHALHVSPGVYVPRAQTEEMARRAAAVLPADGSAVDLCCGSGAVAAHLGRSVPGAVVIGIDVDPVAATCARRNGIIAVVGDLAEPLAADGTVDVVTAVAPYVPTDAVRFLPADVQRHEPRLALDGGADGLALVRRVVIDAARLLRPGGWLLIELGADQAEPLAPDLTAAGFGAIDTWHDEDGDLRGLAARRARA